MRTILAVIPLAALLSGCRHPVQRVALVERDPVIWTDETLLGTPDSTYEYGGVVHHSKWSRAVAYSDRESVYVTNNQVGTDAGGQQFFSLRKYNIGHFPPESPFWWRGYCGICGPPGHPGPTGPTGSIDRDRELRERRLSSCPTGPSGIQPPVIVQ